MRMVKHLSLWLVLWLGLAACVHESVRSGAGQPETVAAAFYGQLRRQPVTGLPSADIWSRSYCTTELTAALEAARVRQTAFRHEHPGEKPPWVDGDLFSSLFEGPQDFRLGKALFEADCAEVPVHCVHGDGAGATRWTDWLILRRKAAGWRVDDLRYGGQWDFALRGSLRQGLAAAE